MPRKARLDAELVRRGLARSREHASELVAAGRVSVRGMVARKSATAVELDAPVLVAEDVDDPGWASRGAHKLLGALEAFEPEGFRVDGRRCLDAGASTGGFTDVLLRRGAKEVVAVDVGYGQLVWKLQTDERVKIHDRTNVRSLTPEEIGGQVELVVADLSFISLKLVLPALIACAAEGADIVPMIKPQFEVGKQRLGSGGVVRDPDLRADAVLEVVRFAENSGLGLRGVVASPLPGPSGNVEYFAWLRVGEGAGAVDADELVAEAVRRGPQSAAKGVDNDVTKASKQW
ncbi:23S rRNA (cytidine1920-2'-O)/16S rRNA (cytidine1409-2'-O)-methyltransferase [Saccharopolyspora erythraea NRRL 2338]|nr:TlyA family RNA methyltransferase [Saccharopolyspora erythraea]EQD83020.1 cytochrome C peroxidase [Saccharopolyspora erythraea D]PFG98130.1 23S rRNA (cytidine1920-2'-O)/16S rRNA (cytidine1409-2'-O)-methyltransferase [Saccharopolyspora erythraea NRRL 2338]QRK88233.1 TlyA family RNA methyltransferase [Saccharopolyspora erythraea]